MRFITIKISEKIYDELKILGLEKQSYQDIIKDLITHTNGCGKYWSTKT